MKKILIVAGTRPEIIKLAPVILVARKRFARHLQTFLCLTGQHSSMARNALDVFSLTPDHNLKVMEKNQTLNAVAMKIFRSLPRVLGDFRPDLVMVQGDTTTAAAAGLSAFHLRIPVAHVEAGLRSFQLDAPFPEELNRRMLGALAEFNFAPTEKARRNLIKENIPEDKIYVTGNTVVDALEHIRSGGNLQLTRSLQRKVKSPFILVTAHRRESFGQGFTRIFSALRLAAHKYPHLQFVYPVHLNPNVKDQAYRCLGDLRNCVLIPPVSYLELLALLSQCQFCLTDSGGIQEEAPSFGKFTIVLREVTERTESVEAGLSALVGTDPQKILREIGRCIGTTGKRLEAVPNPFGDGKASLRICRILSKKLQ